MAPVVAIVIAKGEGWMRQRAPLQACANIRSVNQLGPDRAVDARYGTRPQAKGGILRGYLSAGRDDWKPEEGKNDMPQSKQSVLT